jgi:hypothetical protein
MISIIVETDSETKMRQKSLSLAAICLKFVSQKKVNTMKYNKIQRFFCSTQIYTAPQFLILNF